MYDNTTDAAHVDVAPRVRAYSHTVARWVIYPWQNTQAQHGYVNTQQIIRAARSSLCAYLRASSVVLSVRADPVAQLSILLDHTDGEAVRDARNVEHWACHKCVISWYSIHGIDIVWAFVERVTLLASHKFKRRALSARVHGQYSACKTPSTPRAVACCTIHLHRAPQRRAEA